MALRLVIGFAFWFGGCCLASAEDIFCRNYIDQIDSETLYAVHCSKGANCINRVTNVFGESFLEREDGSRYPLSAGVKYHFIYKVAPNVIRNSLAVVQLKRRENPVRTDATPVKVRLQRDGVAFACVKLKEDVPIASWPLSDVPAKNLPSIEYNKYDQFHRWGFTSTDEYYQLSEKFHLRYFNGVSCVSTTDTNRRWQFLLHDRSNLPTFLLSLLARYGIYTPSNKDADLAEIRKYQSLKVMVRSYQSKKTDSGSVAPACFGFNASTGGRKTDRLDIAISDLEPGAALFPLDGVKEWSFNVQ